MTPDEMRKKAARCDWLARSLPHDVGAGIVEAAAQWRLLAHQTELLSTEWRLIRGRSESLGTKPNAAVFPEAVGPLPETVLGSCDQETRLASDFV